MPANTVTNDIITMGRMSLAAYNNAVSPISGFGAMTNASLGMAAASPSGSTVRWTLTDGIYRATVPNHYADDFGNAAVADIYQKTDANGHITLSIAFRGTDSAADRVLGWGPQMESYYKLFKPLINQIKVYAATHDVTDVLVTGHSLGAAMTQYAMKDFIDTAKTQYHAVTFGSPGAQDSGSTPDNRMLQFEYTDDAFARLSGAPLIDFDKQGQIIKMPLDSTATGKDDHLGFYEHEMSRYLQAIQNFAALGGHVPSFMTTELHHGNTTTHAYAGGSGNDSLRGSSHGETLYGGAGNDTLAGLGGNDWIVGGSGNDWLYGDSGRDVLFGGIGRDSFIFDEKLSSGNVDTISDFVPVDDRIVLNHQIFQNIDKGPLDSSQFRQGDTAIDVNDRIIYNNVDGTVMYDSDGTGQLATVTVAKLAAGLAMTSGDFFVI